MGWFERLFWGGAGAIFLVASLFQKVIYLYPSRHSKTPSETLNLFGRVCFVIGGIGLLYVGITGKTEFWIFQK